MSKNYLIRIDFFTVMLYEIAGKRVFFLKKKKKNQVPGEFDPNNIQNIELGVYQLSIVQIFK